MKNRIQTSINIEAQILLDKKSNLQPSKLEQILKDFECTLIQTNLSDLEVGSPKHLRLENLLGEIKAKQISKISTGH